MEREQAIKLQDNQISYLTQVEIPVTTADFYFQLDPRPLIVFVDGRVHLKTSQMIKDEELRTLLRKENTGFWSVFSTATQTQKRDLLFQEIKDNLGR